MPSRFARAWKAFWSPAEPVQQCITVSVDPVLSADQIKQVTAEIQRRLLQQAQRNRRTGLV